MTLKEAVGEFVTDGCSFALGGLSAREPMATCYEIIRQRKRNLTLVTDSSCDAAELLIAAGCISRIECAYIWIGVIGNGVNYRRAVEKGIPNFIEVEEYSNLGMAARLLAGSMGLPFMPVKTMLGTDIVNVNPRIKVIEDPYGGGPVALVPAANPDVALIHAQRADKTGNAQLWGCYVNDDIMARAAKHVILTCEEIVPTSEIRKIPNMTVIPGYSVSAVVEVPYGCHPVSFSGYYWMDIPFRREIMAAAKTPEGITAWIDEWVFGVENHAEYLKKVGWERLAALKELEVDNYRIPQILVEEGGR
ncbi:MAG: CoA transferase subunit A [Firmicutes bacterium]|nr:CoA transferase subunit A [Bacillota bacterium]